MPYTKNHDSQNFQVPRTSVQTVKRLRIQSILQDKDISQIAHEAFEEYLDRVEKKGPDLSLKKGTKKL